MKQPALTRSLRLILGLGMLALASCGTSEYERRLNSLGLAAAKQGATVASFNTLLYQRGPIAANETPSIRVPQMLAYPYVSGAIDDQFGGKPIQPTELQPAGMQIPGFKATWRGYRSSSQGVSWPVYLYLAQQKVGAGPPLADALMAQLNKAFPGKATPWTDIAFIGEDGVSQVPWKTTQVQGEMSFAVPPSDTPLVSAPSTMQFYVHTSNEWEVLVGFRIPDELENEAKYLVEIAALTCGSVQTTPQAPPQ